MFNNFLHCLQTERSPLRFINLRDDRIIYAVRGQKLVLSVEVEGEPKPNVFWLVIHLIFYIFLI